MTTSAPLIECVPNFSEGRDQRKIEAIADAIGSVDGCVLLHIDTSPAANRTVMTFAGAPEAVAEAAYRSIQKSAEVIDMRQQEGVHPRIGATDVCPLVPLSNYTVAETVALSKMLGSRVGEELGIPVYLYEHSAVGEHRKTLPAIRKGQYEGFAQKITQPEWQPDFGPAVFNAATGATVLGARDILVAFNISLDTKDVAKATYIAERLRASGRFETIDGKRKRIPGLLAKVRAIGWYMADFENAQVSMNLLNYNETSPLKVWEACEALAHEAGTTLIGSEVIGLIPEACLLQAGAYPFIKQGLAVPEDKELLVHNAIQVLKLDKVKPFDPREKVLEYALKHTGLVQ